MVDIALAKKKVLKQVNASYVLRGEYEALTEEMRQKFLDFVTGVKGLPLTYDPFFKKIFNGEIHPERLSRFLTVFIGEKVKVKRVLQNEGTRILEEGSLLIMDIVVELEDGSIANVEIQKVPYLFPGERAACYSSDLVMRQYSRIKSEKKSAFTYRDMKRVYTIVLLEKSDKLFRNNKEAYIHKSEQVFDTGLQLDLLQKYIFISLDSFLEIKQNKIEEEQDAWLYLLSSEDPGILLRIIKKYPEFTEIYDDIVEFRKDVGGVLSMFSEALRILDRNTVQYMIDEMKEELEEQKKEIKDIDLQLKSKEFQLKEKDFQLKDKELQLQNKDSQLQEKDKRIKELENLLSQK